MTHTRLFVRHRAGSGEPVVHLHGLGGSSLNFVPLMEVLGADPVPPDQYAPDLPGFGQSPPPDDGDLSPSGQARVVIAWLQALGVGPVHLVGNSLGGAIAVLLTADRPDLVRSLTLISPALPDLRPGLQRLQVASVALPGIGRPLARAVTRMDPERRVDAMLDWLYADPAVASAEERTAAAAEFARRAALPYAPDVLVAATRGAVRSYLGWGPERVWRRAGTITAPTLLVFARGDRLVDARLAARAFRSFRKARVHVLADAGHVPQLERPALIARLIRGHLDRNSVRSAAVPLLHAAALPGDASLARLGARGRSLAVDDNVAVLRLALPGEPEQVVRAETAATAAAAAAGVGPALLSADHRGLITAWAAGAPLDPAQLRGTAGAGGRARAAQALRRLHGSATSDAATADIAELDLAGLRQAYREELRTAGGTEPPGYAAAVDALPGLGEPDRLVLCHGDAVPENLIDDGAAVHLVDLEFARLAEPAVDLATLAVAAGLSRAEVDDLLMQYGPGVLPARVRLLSDHLRAAWLPWALLPAQAASARAAPWAVWPLD